MEKFVGMTVEELINKGFELIEENCEDYDDEEVYDVYRAYWGYLVLVKDGVAVYDLED